jgi:hypothetical protein
MQKASGGLIPNTKPLNQLLKSCVSTSALPSRFVEAGGAIMIDGNVAREGLALLGTAALTWPSQPGAPVSSTFCRQGTLPRTPFGLGDRTGKK